MEHLSLLLIAMFLMAFCLLGQWFTRTIVTAPMLALGFGTLLAWGDLVPEQITKSHLHVLAEISLVILLFLDAARIDIRGLLRRHTWPLRTLLLGMPLAFLGGTVICWLLFPDWPLAVAALIAAMLVPTDAALGQSVVMNPDVPERHRRAITIESGLNDGIALPLILMLAAVMAPATSAPAGGWVVYTLLQVTLGPLVGAGLGVLGGVGLIMAQDRALTSPLYEGIATLSLAAAAYFAATAVGGNGFIAAFAAGIGFACIVRDRCKFVFDFSESEGQLLSWSAFFLIGALLVPDAIASLDAPMVAAIALSLLIVRPLAIWLSLIGSDADPASRVFIGWFGPRGLATALFALLVAEQLAPELGDFILHLAINTVWISALLHGVTSVPLAKAFAGRTSGKVTAE